MHRKIFSYIRKGETKEALNAAISWSLQLDAKKIYNELVLVSSRLYRTEKDYLLNLISFDEREKVQTASTAMVVGSVAALKKNS